MYRFVTWVMEPAIVMVTRCRRSPAGQSNKHEKADGNLIRPSGRVVWMHGVSVGESLSLLPLAEELQSQCPDIAVLITSRTRTAAQVLAERLPPEILHCYAPPDLPRCVARFLDKWNPALLVLAESELWPNLITMAHARGVPVVSVNARMSIRSVRNWQRIAQTARQLLHCIDAVFAQDDAAARGWRAIGADANQVEITGTLKAAAPPLPVCLSELETMQQQIGDRPVWLAASTHDADENIVLAAHREVCRHLADALLVLVPRHPERGKRIADKISAWDWEFTQRSITPTLDGNENVYLADTLGELGLWYRLAPVAFIGGSFNGVGGHNSFEAVQLNTAVLHGPDVDNFSDIYRRLTAGHAARSISTAHELATEVVQALGVDGKGRPAAEMAAHGQAVIETLPNAVAYVAQRLAGYVRSDANWQ